MFVKVECWFQLLLLVEWSASFLYWSENSLISFTLEGDMEVAPSINEILIRTSPECLCSRMRNMEKMGKEWGDLLSILGGLIS